MDETKAKSIFWVRLADGKTKRLSTIPSLAASVVPKNTDSSWETGLLKEEPGLLVEIK